MKNLFIFGLMLFTICTAQSQDAVRKQEFQVSLDVVEGIGRTNAYYKIGFKNQLNNYWRARTGQSHNFIYPVNQNARINKNERNIGCGFETRLKILKNALMGLGVELYASSEDYRDYLSNIQIIESRSWSTGVILPISINLNGFSKWYVGAELAPGWIYKRKTRDDLDVYRFNSDKIEFGMSGYALCFGYRIPTKRI